jgi:glucuronokinase
MNISDKNIEMVEIARSEGASAKFTGSGGAIIGTYEDDKMYEKLKKVLDRKNITIIKPEIL